MRCPINPWQASLISDISVNTQGRAVREEVVRGPREAFVELLPISKVPTGRTGKGLTLIKIQSKMPHEEQAPGWVFFAKGNAKCVSPVFVHEN